jgi:hypothetical protein
MNTMPWLHVLVGAVLLLFGRKLFWLFVGCIGFIVGFDFASHVLQGRAEWLIVLIALGAGLAGVIASIFLQRLVVGIAGFLAGGYFLSSVGLTVLHTHQQAVQWIAYSIGGILGAMLTLVLLDPALIILSSLAGATAICGNVPLTESNKGILFIALLILGIVVQTMQYRRRPAPGPPKGERAERNR